MKCFAFLIAAVGGASAAQAQIPAATQVLTTDETLLVVSGDLTQRARKARGLRLLKRLTAGGQLRLYGHSATLPARREFF